MMGKRIMIVEDEILVAIDIKMMLENHGYEVAGIAGNYAAAIRLFKDEKPDLMICDINLKTKKTGVDLVIKTRHDLKVPIIFVSAIVDDELLEQALSLNPESYLTKPFNENQLIVAVRRVLKNGNGNKVYSDNGGATPTKRELEIIQLIAKGHTTKQIAKILNISFETVQSHRKNVLHKFKLNSSAELISIAYGNNWVN